MSAPPDGRDGRLPQENDRRDIVKATTPDSFSVQPATDFGRAWTCTWCPQILPKTDLACQSCLSDVVAQLRRRKDADARLIPLHRLSESA